MGVSGAGKSTVGKALAASLGWRFLEGDDFHPPANVEKMRNGKALDDRDRAPWLTALREAINRQLAADEDTVLTCSALKASYRQRLQAASTRVKFVYLKGDYALIRGRLRERPQHFMPAQLLKSQLRTLNAPRDALVIDARAPVDDMVQAIRKAFEL